MIGAPSATHPAARAATPVAMRTSLRAFIERAPSVPASRGVIDAPRWGDVEESASDLLLIHGIPGAVRP
jgi:hypothetical protein